MNEFIKITPDNHEEIIRTINGKLFILYYSIDCVFCRQAIANLLSQPENSLFSYGVCQVDDAKDFRLKENILSLPTVRIYENGNILRETNGYNQAYGSNFDMRLSIEKCKNYHTVYADNAATTKMSKKAIRAFVECAKDNYGNPSTNYGIGVEAKTILNNSRVIIRNALNMNNGRIIFTSGGSEADNLAIYSACQEGIKQGKRHIITSAIEHHAVLNTLEHFKEDGFEITVLNVNQKGKINLKELEKAIRPDTILVSIMYANNEIGTLQPVKDIGEICAKFGVLFHCDAVQAVGHIKINLSDLKIDYMSIAAHKFNGPKGVGALITSDNAPVFPLILGGSQESSLRAGTENVQGIYSMAVALREHAKHIKSETRKTEELMSRLILGLNDITEIVYNGDRKNCLPGTINVSFKEIKGRELLFLLDAKYGICVSGGSACNTNSQKPSHVLLSLGLSQELAESAIRISLNQDNTTEDVDYIVNALKESVTYLKSMQKKI